MCAHVLLGIIIVVMGAQFTTGDNTYVIRDVAGTHILSSCSSFRDALNRLYIQTQAVRLDRLDERSD